MVECPHSTHNLTLKLQKHVSLYIQRLTKMYVEDNTVSPGMYDRVVVESETVWFRET